MNNQSCFCISRVKPTRKDARKLRAIAKREGAVLVEAVLPGIGYQRWFAARNYGYPFDRDRALRVADAIADAGLV